MTYLELRLFPVKWCEFTGNKLEVWRASEERKGWDLCLVPFLSGPIARRIICFYHYGAWDVYDLNVCTNINILKSLLSPLKCKTIHFECFFFVTVVLSTRLGSQSLFSEDWGVALANRSKESIVAGGVHVGVICQMRHDAKFIMTGKINEELAQKEPHSDRLFDGNKTQETILFLSEQTSHVTLTVSVHRASLEWRIIYLSLRRAVTRCYFHIYFHLIILKSYYAFKKKIK